MNAHRTHSKRVRLAVFLTIVLVLGGTGGAITALTLGAGTTSSAVSISEGLITGSDDSIEVRWPKNGESAMAIGDGTIAANSDKALPMASISKLITALIILEVQPLSPTDHGPSYEFTYDDESVYLDMMHAGMSALPVPVGGALTQYQMLEGILVGSACNYVDYLVADIWGSNDAFVAAAASFLARHGLTGITMVEPTGIDYGNTATPSALIAVGRMALANPVIAEIVDNRTIDLPGVGLVENTNDLLADPGVVGLKTGTLDGYNLLSAKDIAVADGTTVRVFVVVLNQMSDDDRFSSSRSLYDQVARLTS